jgi:putative transposase
MKEKLEKHHRYPWPVIEAAVMWYQRYPLTYRAISERLVGHGVEVSHKTVYEWVQKFGTTVQKNWKKKANNLAKWSVNEEYMKVNGEWRHLYRAVDGTGNTLSVVTRGRRDLTAAKAFLKKTIDELENLLTESDAE